MLKYLKWFAFSVVVLATLALLVVALENYRGKRAWLAYRAELEAQGERLDLDAHRPPPVPDEQNFARTPLLAPLLDYQLDPHTREVHWRDTNASERPRNLFGWRRYADFRSAGWRGGEFYDLAACQKELRRQTRSNDPQIQALLATPEGRPETDLLFLLGLNRAELDEIRAAAQRPASSFQVHVEEGISALLPQLAVLKSFAGAFESKALAELSAGNLDAAFADTDAALAMSDALKQEPLLISGLVRLAVFEMALQPLWEGLARRQWTPAQVEAFQSRLQRLNLVEEMQRSLRSERAFSLAALDELKRDRRKSAEIREGGLGGGAARFMPSGWFYQNQLNIARMFQESFATLDPARRTVDLARAHQTAGDIDLRLRRPHPYTLFASMLLPAIDRAVAKTARTQATVSLALTACALERHRMDQGRYPKALEDLLPQYLDRLPLDPVIADSLQYRLLSDGRFLLYSVGLDRDNDDGEVPRDKQRRAKVDVAEGDWVWQYPAGAPR